MKECNLKRLIDICPFSDKLSDGCKDALLDFLIDTDATIDINIDDIIVNGITRLTVDEFNESYTKKEQEDLYILYRDNDDDEIYILN